MENFYCKAQAERLRPVITIRRAKLVDGAPGLDKAIASVWDGVPVQLRCTVHKHRNLFAHAPERLHDEITAGYNEMIYATTPGEIEARRKSFVRKWRLKHRGVADSLEEAGELVHLHSPATKPMAQLAHHQCNQAAARRVQARD